MANLMNRKKSEKEIFTALESKKGDIQQPAIMQGSSQSRKVNDTVMEDMSQPFNPIKPFSIDPTQINCPEKQI